MKNTFEFIPIDYDYFDFEGKNYAKIIGRTDKGKKACIIDTCDIYFWAILKPDVPDKRIKQIQEEIEKIIVENSQRECKVLSTEIHNKNFLGEKVKAIKIFITNAKDAHDIADRLDFKEIDKRREYDLDFITKYILEKKFKPLNWYKVEGELLNNSSDFGGIDKGLDVDICLKLEKHSKIDKEDFKPRILAYDIETDEFEIGKGEIVLISLVGDNYKKVLTWKKESLIHDYVEKFSSEKEMLEAFVKYVKEYSPDILTGYFSDGFDLPYLRQRAEKNKTRLNLGIDNTQPTLSRGKVMTARIKGIVHLDVFRFIKVVYGPYLQSETMSLNDVASELLGDKKVKYEFKHSSKLSKEEWETFFEYNLQDSSLTYRLAEKIWPDLMEFSKVVGEPLFDVSRYSMSNHVENYIIHNIEKYNEIIEKKPISEIGDRMAEERFEGAFVFQPKPGLYENIVFFDFTSMYGSVIVTFNLSRSTFKNNKESNSIEVDLDKKKAYFSKKPGFFPEMLADIIEKRKKYKKEYAEKKDPLSKARSNAFKLLANASYGYQGFFGARYYCLEAAASTAALARKYIHETISKIEKKGYHVVYSDSVDGKTKLFIKKNKIIYEEEIENLFQKIDQKSHLGKEYDFKKDIEILTLDEKGKSVFKPITYVMRHESNKKMYRIHFTNQWHIDVTEDHSLMGYQSDHFNQSRINKINPLNRIIKIKPDEINKKANSIISLKKIPDEYPNSKNYPKEVYEFMGYFIGDGSFMRNKTNKKYNKDYYLRLSLGKDKEEVFNKLIKPLKEIGYIKNHWWSKSREGDLVVNGLKLVKIISKEFSKENKKIIPEWIFYEKEENIASFLRGLFSADGCVIIRDNTPIIKYTSINENYIMQVRKLLYKVGIANSVFKENNINIYKDKKKQKSFSNGSHSKNIILKNNKYFAEKVGFILDRKNKLAKIKTNEIKKKNIKNFEFEIQQVKSIEEIKTPKYVYDIEVEENHRFFANYVLVHNTDSIAFLRDKHSKKEVLETLKEINDSLPGIMELDLEDFYKRGIWVTKRTGDFGAKKKYALITEEGKLKIRGFETVRRDWCELARVTQNKVLDYILNEGTKEHAIEYVKDIIKKLKERKIPLKQLLIRTQLKKSIEEYKSESPHVTIAKKMKERNIRTEIGMLMEYYISESESHNKKKNGKSKQLIRERAKLPDEEGLYDIDYYLDNQLLPAVENILEVFDINANELLEGKKQTSLGDF